MDSKVSSYFSYPPYPLVLIIFLKALMPIDTYDIPATQSTVDCLIFRQSIVYSYNTIQGGFILFWYRTIIEYLPHLGCQFVLLYLPKKKGLFRFNISILSEKSKLAKRYQEGDIAIRDLKAMFTRTQIESS